MTSKCHAEVIDHEFLHWPNIKDKCRKCHSQEGTKHSFAPADTRSFCLICHNSVADAVEEEKHVHQPVEKRCVSCHDAHGSSAKALLRADKIEDLCFKCHDSSDFIDDEFQHGPVAQGACTSCHSPHASSHDALLVEDAEALCFGCHEERAKLAEAAEYRHDLADCVDCHNPHSSPNSKMLRGAKRKLCGECHDFQLEEAEDSAVDHAPVLTGEECLNCHSPHEADHAPMLKASQTELCLGCHDKPLDSGDSVLKDMKGWLSSNKEWHEPLREQSCTGCHLPHGGNHFRLLKGEFPAQFYSGFAPERYELCFSCHPAEVFTEATTRELTGFRDGARNLHFLHVNKSKRGRTCRACHEVHAASEPFHIRATVPYGTWMLPINFKKEATGGSCHPGCHSLKTYDREKP
ncbi:MAG: cytochrome c3 family protein [Candidatus Binatia bacterium]